MPRELLAGAEGSDVTGDSSGPQQPEDRQIVMRHGIDKLILRGAVRDQKPPGLYFDDTQPLTVHHMIVDLTIGVPSLEITAAKAVLEIHPHSTCKRIEDHYEKLVGLSISRGYTHKIRELFGGPRGCTHTTALLQAMAPVAIQSMWSFNMAQTQSNDDRNPFSNPESRQAVLMTNINSCHVWAEDSDHVASLRNGEPMEVPLWITKRFEQLGRDPAEFRRRT